MSCSSIAQPFFYPMQIQAVIHRDLACHPFVRPDYDVQNPFKNLWINSGQLHCREKSPADHSNRPFVPVVFHTLVISPSRCLTEQNPFYQHRCASQQVTTNKFLFIKLLLFMFSGPHQESESPVSSGLARVIQVDSHRGPT